jgi:hypothetical protein
MVNSHPMNQTLPMKLCCSIRIRSISTSLCDSSLRFVSPYQVCIKARIVPVNVLDEVHPSVGRHHDRRDVEEDYANVARQVDAERFMALHSAENPVARPLRAI